MWRPDAETESAAGRVPRDPFRPDPFDVACSDAPNLLWNADTPRLGPRTPLLPIGSAGRGPMAGILIYTAASDSEGTRGGLVQLGQPVTLGRQIQHALESMRICASDPLCAEHAPVADGRNVHGACCHACLFAPRRRAERGNRFRPTALVATLQRERRFSRLTTAADHGRARRNDSNEACRGVPRAIGSDCPSNLPDYVRVRMPLQCIELPRRF